MSSRSMEVKFLLVSHHVGCGIYFGNHHNDVHLKRYSDAGHEAISHCTEKVEMPIDARLILQKT